MAERPKAVSPNCLRLMLEILVCSDNALSCLTMRAVPAGHGWKMLAADLEAALPTFRKSLSSPNCDPCHDNMSR